MGIVDSYGSEVLKQDEDVSFQSTTEQPEGTSEPILRAFLIDIPSTEIDPMHAPTVEKPTYSTLILALGPLLSTGDLMRIVPNSELLLPDLRQ